MPKAIAVIGASNEEGKIATPSSATSSMAATRAIFTR